MAALLAPASEHTIRPDYFMKKHFYLLVLVLLGTWLFHPAYAQDGTPTPTTARQSVIHMKDGSTLRGQVIAETNDEVVVRTDNLGEVRLSRDKIDRLEELTDGYYRNGQYWFPNPHSTRYFFAPSALTLKKGEGYYQNTYVFVNSAVMGVTDHFTMGAGFVLNPTFRDWQVFFITPKVSFPSQGPVTLGAGLIGVGIFNRAYNYDYQTNTTTSKINLDLAGIAYGNVTLGNSEQNATLGLGWAFANEEFASSPILNFNYMTRVGRKVGLVTENWLLIGNSRQSAVGLLSGGVRFFGERTSIDLALWVPAAAGLDTFIAIPYVDFVLKFGKKKKVQ